MCIAITPCETDTPPVIDADAVRSGTTTLQCFQPVSWRNAKILQSPRLMEVQELPSGGAFDRLKSADRAIAEKCLGVLALEVAYQFHSMTRRALRQTSCVIRASE
jgi:hypothetical protein